MLSHTVKNNLAFLWQVGTAAVQCANYKGKGTTPSVVPALKLGPVAFAIEWRPTAATVADSMSPTEVARGLQICGGFFFSIQIYLHMVSIPTSLTHTASSRWSEPPTARDLHELTQQLVGADIATHTRLDRCTQVINKARKQIGVICLVAADFPKYLCRYVTVRGRSYMSQDQWEPRRQYLPSQQRQKHSRDQELSRGRQQQRRNITRTSS